MRFGGVDHVVAVIEPMADQLFDQRRRVLAVAVHEQQRAVAGMLQAGHQAGFLAEIARQRQRLNVETDRRQVARDRIGVVAGTVVDIDDLDPQAPRCAQLLGGFAQPRMKGRQIVGLVVAGHDDGKAGLGALSRGVALTCDFPAGADRHCALIPALRIALVHI